MEVNAAIEGFARGGATDFLVADGHGHGAIHPERARDMILAGAERAIRTM